MQPIAAPTVYVDADACPVKAEVERVAGRHGLVTVHVANFGLRPSRDPLVRTVMVPQGADAADDWIVAHLHPADIAVTADILLARRVLEAGAFAIGPSGRLFTPEAIGMAVAMRDLHQHLRETGDLPGRNPSFTPKDRSAFLHAFDVLVQRALRGAS